MFPRPVVRGGVVESVLRNWRKLPGSGGGGSGANAAAAVVTHRSLAGGNYVVDEPRRLVTALAAAARDRSCVHYLIEQRTPIHPMIVDLDFAFSTVVGDEQWLQIVGVLQAVMREVLPGAETLNAHVAIAPPDHVAKKQLDMGAGEKQEFTGFVKSGLHIYWSGAFVDMPTALLIRGAFIQRLTEAFGYSHPTDSAGKRWPPWSTIVDESVLTANGLRMLHAHKASHCTACHSSSNAASKKRGRPTDALAPLCDTCQGRGLMDYGRPYVPHWVVGADGAVHAELTARFREDFFYAFNMTTVRSAHTAMPAAPHVPDWVKRLHVEMPRSSNPNDGQQRHRSNNDGEAAVDSGSNGGYTKVVNGQSMTFALDENRDGRREERLRAIERFINEETTLAGTIMPQTIRRLLKSDHGGQYFLAVGENKYCNNVRRRHHNQDVYYVLSLASLWQCCWSRRQRDTDVNMTRDCRGYSSPHFPLSATLRELLFNPHVNRTTIAAEESWNRHKVVARYYLNPRDVEQEARYVHARALLPLLRADSSAYKDSPLVQLLLRSEEAVRVYTDIMGFPRVDQ